MLRLDKQTFIRRIAAENRSDPEGARVLWSRHAVAELAMEDWTRDQVENALRRCQVVEDYPASHRPLPDCLVLSWLADDVPIHAVIALDEDRGRILIVTVYRPSEEEWEDDWKTRR